jgi:hypothetical protein
MNFNLPMPSGNIDILLFSIDKYLKCLSRYKDSAIASIFTLCKCSVRRLGKERNESPG